MYRPQLFVYERSAILSRDRNILLITVLLRASAQCLLVRWSAAGVTALLDTGSDVPLTSRKLAKKHKWNVDPAGGRGHLRL